MLVLLAATIVTFAALAEVAIASPRDDVMAAIKKAEAAGSWEFVAVNKMGKETGLVEPPSYAFGKVEGGPSTLITGGKQYIDYGDGRGFQEVLYHGTMSILFIIPPVYALASDQITLVGWRPLPSGKPAKLYHIVDPKGALDLYVGNDGYPYRLVTPEGTVDYSNFGRTINKVQPK
jgi:hypothetical protein